MRTLFWVISHISWPKGRREKERVCITSLLRKQSIHPTQKSKVKMWNHVRSSLLDNAPNYLAGCVIQKRRREESPYNEQLDFLFRFLEIRQYLWFCRRVWRTAAAHLPTVKYEAGKQKAEEFSYIQSVSQRRTPLLT